MAPSIDRYPSAKPYTRWWWFSGEISDDVICYQLDWVRQNGFGGVEIAWLYPQEGAKTGPMWLSPEWSRKVTFAKQCADARGLGCDFTFGTSWPFGGSIVPEHDAARIYSGLSPQRLEKSWEWPHEGYILNHLDRSALGRYADVMSTALVDALRGSPSALFCDSWEVLTEQLWTTGFGDEFKARFGYAIEDYISDIDKYPNERYDYRKLIAEYVLREFYQPFTDITHRLGAFSRVQCHGAPVDLLAAYANVDVPESEAILFDPEFSRIAASAAVLSGKPVTSVEAFTCLYGWVAKPGPGPYQKHEHVADMKLLIDALFANGINQVFWHGMPYNPPGGDNQFYATVHVGPDSAWADEIPAFNAYMQKVSQIMRQGKTYASLAVYLPIEDTWMLGTLPSELQKPSALYHWEMHYARTPEMLKGYSPVWLSAYFLKNANYEDAQLHCGDATFTALYVDVEWLDPTALDDLLRLARQGLPVFLGRLPREPGRIKTKLYDRHLTELVALSSVTDVINAITACTPLVTGEDLPDFWCRVDDRDMHLFFANPLAHNLRYPLAYGYALSSQMHERRIGLSLPAGEKRLQLHFQPQQSILVTVSPSGAARFADIAYTPITSSANR